MQVSNVFIRVLGAAAVMAAVAACGSGGNSPAGPASSKASTSKTASKTASSSTTATGASESEETTEPAASSADNQHLLQAGETARGAVADSTVYSIETEDSDTQWEVHVVTSDGSEHKVTVSGDGATVTAGPKATFDTSRSKTEHRERVEAAKLDYRAAVDKVTQSTPGRITELKLDSADGVVVWEADVVGSDNTEQRVRIDAGTGDVVAN